MCAQIVSKFLPCISKNFKFNSAHFIAGARGQWPGALQSSYCEKASLSQATSRRATIMFFSSGHSTPVQSPTSPSSPPRIPGSHLPRLVTKTSLPQRYQCDRYRMWSWAFNSARLVSVVMNNVQSWILCSEASWKIRKKKTVYDVEVYDQKYPGRYTKSWVVLEIRVCQPRGFLGRSLSF